MTRWGINEFLPSGPPHEYFCIYESVSPEEKQNGDKNRASGGPSAQSFSNLYLLSSGSSFP